MPQTNYPDARKFIDAGEMISDAVVCDALLEELLGAQRRAAPCGGGAGAEGGGGECAGVVVDGFPRTAVQVGGRAGVWGALWLLHFVGGAPRARLPRRGSG